MIYLEEARPIQTDSYSLPDNLSRIDQVIQDSVVHGHQSARSGSLLLQLVGFPGGLGQDPPLGNEDHMLATELLLQFSHQPGLNVITKLSLRRSENAPGLDLLERLQLGNRHEDHEAFLALAAVHLLGGGDVELPQGGLEVTVHLQVQQGLADLLLDLVGLLIVSLDNLPAGESHSSEMIQEVDVTYYLQFSFIIMGATTR